MGGVKIPGFISFISRGSAAYSKILTAILFYFLFKISILNYILIMLDKLYL